MALTEHNSPSNKSRGAMPTKSITSQDVLVSCKTVEELEKLVDQYAALTDLLQALPQGPMDELIAETMKLEMMKIETALQKLTVATREAEELKADLKSMMDYVKDTRLNDKIDDVLRHTIQPSSVSLPEFCLPSAQKSRDETAFFKNANENEKGIDKVDVGIQVDEAVNDENNGQKINQTEKTPQKQKGVTLEEFMTVPDHIKGRLTVEKINETVEMIREVTRLKYRLIRKRGGLTPLEKEAITRMRLDIVPAVRECRFITEEDVYLFKQKKLPKSTMSHLIVLRHLQKIREVRDRNIIRIVLKC